MSEMFQPPNIPRAVAEAVQTGMENHLHEMLVSQPWWRRYSNTVTSIVAYVTSLVWLAIGLGAHVSGFAVWAVAVLLAVGGVVGVRKTPNGVTPNLVDLVVKELGRTNTTGRHRLNDGR